MINSKKQLSMAVSSTAVALIDFAALILMIRSAPPLLPLAVMLVSEVVLIAWSILQWVKYFRGYIAEQIGNHLRGPGAPD